MPTIASDRPAPGWRKAAVRILGAGFLAALPAGGPAAQAVATPVEIAASVVNGEVRCGPPRARLPARDTVDLMIVNRAERPVWFVAPAFFQGAEHIDSRGFTLDLVQGGFLVAPESRVGVVLRTPGPGEYPYACYEPAAAPRPSSSGFLVVAPTAS